MKMDSFSRRDFLKLAALGLSGLAFRPYLFDAQVPQTDNIVRIARDSLNVYKSPNDESEIMLVRYQRDDLAHVYYEVDSPDGPDYNPHWYRVWGGYIHSAFTQKVKYELNPVINVSTEKKSIGEITVPFSQSYRYIRKGLWEPVYRLYYESIHWVNKLDEGPDGKPWYAIYDELLKVEYHVPAEHVRILSEDELAPISPDVPHHKKRVEVSLAKQTLTAYENEAVVLQTKICSGIAGKRVMPGELPWGTPQGTYNIQAKTPSKHMGDGNLTDNIYAYELPGVPWVCFFIPDIGVAFHGTYWHTNYGVQMSHGCINMRCDEAKWLYRWVRPVADLERIETIGMGTRVDII